MNLMNNAVINTPYPINEPVLDYAPGSPEKKALKAALAELSSKQIEIPLVIGGERVTTGRMGQCIMPHDHGHLLGKYHKAGAKEIAADVAEATGAAAGAAVDTSKDVAEGVVDAAKGMVEEVRRQFKEKPGIMEGTDTPDYARPVAISCSASLQSQACPCPPPECG